MNQHVWLLVIFGQMPCLGAADREKGGFGSRKKGGKAQEKTQYNDIDKHKQAGCPLSRLTDTGMYGLS
jgi:hypothetical protein